MWRKVVLAVLLCLHIVFIFPASIAVARKPDVALQLSKAIAEWRLLGRDKGTIEIESPIYVSSSLIGKLEDHPRFDVNVVNGLSALIDLKHVPDPILWRNAQKLNSYYNGNIKIIIDTTIDKPGRTVTEWHRYRGYTSGRGVILVNPGKFAQYNTSFGRVLAHEMHHAEQSYFRHKMGIPQYGVIEKLRTDLHLQSTLTRERLGIGKAEWIPPTEWRAIDADNAFQKSAVARVRTEATIARKMGIRYNPHTTYRISEAQALRNIPKVDQLDTIQKWWRHKSPDNYTLMTKPLPSSAIGVWRYPIVGSRWTNRSITKISLSTSNWNIHSTSWKIQQITMSETSWNTPKINFPTTRWSIQQTNWNMPRISIPKTNWNIPKINIPSTNLSIPRTNWNIPRISIPKTNW